MERTTGSARFAGIDTHKDTNMLALLDGACNVIGAYEFPTGAAGYEELERCIGDPQVIVGVEGCRSYGAGIAEHLAARGYAVHEVIRPKRQQRRRGKTDAIDAIAAARNVAAGEGSIPKTFDEDLSELRCLMLARDGFEKTMTQLANRIDALLVTLPEDMRALYRDLRGDARIAKMASSRPREGALCVCRLLARERSRLDEVVRGLDARIGGIVRRKAPNLLGARGVGPVSAARVMIAVGSDPHRMRNEAAFSMLCGTSPVPASSGKTVRHRLNRGGDRQANRAIHDVIYTRMSFDGRTKDYIAKKVSQGKSTKEAMRCLARFVARELYGLLTSPQVPLPDPQEMAKARKRAGLTQTALAEALGVNAKRISNMECGKSVDGDLIQKCLAHCAALEAGSAIQG